jgi:hypothetical protein
MTDVSGIGEISDPLSFPFLGIHPWIFPNVIGVGQISISSGLAIFRSNVLSKSEKGFYLSLQIWICLWISGIRSSQQFYFCLCIFFCFSLNDALGIGHPD